jgi:Holliday junction resolvase
MSAEQDTALKVGITRELEKLGFVVTPVPSVPSQRSPDFIATKGGETFVFELKEKLDDSEALRDESARLDAGELVSFAEPLGPNASVSEKVRYGTTQLLAHKSPAGAYHLLWLHAGGRDCEVQFEQFKSTIYGITNIFGPDRTDLVRCYYFDHSSFHKWKDVLAGAIITTPTSLQVCINTLHPRVAEFRESALVASFTTGLLDPQRLECDGTAYIADCDADRNDKQSVLSYLQSKYGRPMLSNMNLGKLGAKILKRKDSEEQDT